MDTQSRIPTPSSSSPSRTRRTGMMFLYSALAAVLAVSALWQLGAGRVAAPAAITTSPNPPSPACVNVVRPSG
jgi:hypothetical protein